MSFELVMPRAGLTMVEGTISALTYEEPRQGGWFGRLFG